MYIKYKSLSDQKVSIINVNLSNCKTITTENSKLIINMPIDLKDKTITLALSSNEDAIKSLERLFETLHAKSPIGNLLDLTNLDEELIIKKDTTTTIIEEEDET